mmetsp:Transcript_125677/g.367159  ORF Transcript_125677/g.367159 Transcript_125677/m.367159 type:complete len:216 (+) Transcript_125677:2047-2694(+)
MQLLRIRALRKEPCSAQSVRKLCPSSASSRSLPGRQAAQAWACRSATRPLAATSAATSSAPLASAAQWLFLPKVSRWARRVRSLDSSRTASACWACRCLLSPSRPWPSRRAALSSMCMRACCLWSSSERAASSAPSASSISALAHLCRSRSRTCSVTVPALPASASFWWESCSTDHFSAETSSACAERLDCARCCKRSSLAASLRNRRISLRWFS